MNFGKRKSGDTGPVLDLPLAPGSERVHDALQRAFGRVGPLLPMDSVLLLALLRPHLDCSPTELRGHVDSLLHRQAVRCVIVGTEPHLALAEPSASRRSDDNSLAGSPEIVGAQQSAPTVPPDGPSEDPGPKPEQDDSVFNLRVDVDTELERVLLYRVAIVLLALAGLTIARQWAMFLLRLQ